MLRIITKTKQAGKRRNVLAPKEYVIEQTPKTLKELIAEIVRQNVMDFNHNKDEDLLVDFLSTKDMEELAEYGKISFGDAKNREKQNTEKAIENALVSHEDGLYMVFINESEIKNLEDEIALKENDEVLFIRLMMLAGRLW